MKKLYKILVDSKSCHGGDLTWSLPKKDGKKWIPGDWHKVDTVKICNSGLHLTDKPYTWYKWGCSCYEAEVKGEPIWEDNKCVVGEARLLKVVPHPKWWNDCVGWVNTLKSIAWLKPDGKPNKEWKLFETRDAARDAAWDVAWNAARNAARDAARDAAWDAAWDAARNAAEDAALYSRGIFICDGLKLEKKHTVHLKKRMEVWQKGYGLLCDVDGVLYVYKKI